MKQSSYLKTFAAESKADAWMRMKNRANRLRGHLWVVVDGPESDFAVMDIKSAIAGNFMYRWA